MKKMDWEAIKIFTAGWLIATLFAWFGLGIGRQMGPVPPLPLPIFISFATLMWLMMVSVVWFDRH